MLERNFMTAVWVVDERECLEWNEGSGLSTCLQTQDVVLHHIYTSTMYDGHRLYPRQSLHKVD
jgi:hypothetical protein